MSANKRRKPGRAVRQQPNAGQRLVKSPEAHPARVPGPDLALALEDLQRRYREWGVWEERAVTDRKRAGRKPAGGEEG